MSKLYEMVELANGDIALQNDDIETGESLVTMRFSAELIHVLQDAKIDLAKVMVEAGLEFVAKLAEERAKAAAKIEQDDVKTKKEFVESKKLTSSKIGRADVLSNKSKSNDKKSGSENQLEEELEEEMISHLVH